MECLNQTMDRLYQHDTPLDGEDIARIGAEYVVKAARIMLTQGHMHRD